MTQNPRSGVGKLSDDKRKAIALQALARTEPISVLAERNGVSRPTVYRQIGMASAALDEAFDTTRAANIDQVLFMLPVTRQWLDQVIVALTMVGHVSFRSTLELMRDLLGVSTSLGTIHTVLQQAAQQAIAINAGVDLSAIRVGLHDELFQGSQPVLAGIDVASTYCYLLAPEAHRDGDTWAIHLLDLQAQGLDPEHTIADAGSGLRAGQKIAWPDTPCHGDVFHIIEQGKSLATLWHRVASGARTEREQLEARLANPRRRCEDSLLEAALETLRRNESPLLRNALPRLSQMARAIGMDLQGSTVSLDGVYDCRANRKAIFNRGMTPNIPENRRGRKAPTRGRKQRFDPAIFEERFRTIERVFAWEDKFRRLLLRFERISDVHYAFKTLAYTLINLRHYCWS